MVSGDNDYVSDLRRISEQAEQAHRRLKDVGGELGQIKGVGEGAGGKVKARTDADGRVIQVTLDPRAMRLSSQDLAEEITLAVQRAQDDGDAQRERLLGASVGEGPQTPDKVMEQFEDVLQSFNRVMDEQESKIDRILRELD